MLLYLYQLCGRTTWTDHESLITPNSHFYIAYHTQDIMICKKCGSCYYYEVSIFVNENERNNPPTISRSVNNGLLEIGTHSLNLTKRGIRTYCCLECNITATDPVPAIMYFSIYGKAVLYLQTENPTKVYPVHNMYLSGSFIYEE